MVMTSRIVQVAALVCVFTLLSSIGTLGASLLNSPPAFFLTLFEAIVIGASVVGLRSAWRRTGPDLEWVLLCVALAIAGASVAGYLGAGKKVMGIDLRAHVLARVASAALVGLGALAWAVRDDAARAWRRLLVAGLLLVPLVGVGGFLATGAGRRFVDTSMQGLAGMIAALALLILGTGLLAASVQIGASAFTRSRAGGGAGVGAGAGGGSEALRGRPS